MNPCASSWDTAVNPTTNRGCLGLVSLKFELGSEVVTNGEGIKYSQNEADPGETQGFDDEIPLLIGGSSGPVVTELQEKYQSAVSVQLCGDKVVTPRLAQLREFVDDTQAAWAAVLLF